MLDAEKWASLAWVLAGRAYPSSDLTEDWKKVLFNQFHDVAAGSGIGVIYKDAQKDYDVVHWSTNEISSDSIEKVAEGIDTLPKDLRPIPVIVYNPLGWNRSGDVSVKVQFKSGTVPDVKVLDGTTGKVIHILTAAPVDKKSGVTELTFNVPDVPALGYKVIQIEQERTVDSFDFLDSWVKQVDRALILANKSLQVAVDETSGCITSLYDSHSGFESVAPGACGNQLLFFKDTPKEYDAWNIDPGTLDTAPSVIEKADLVELVGQGTVHPAIRIIRHWQNSKFVQTISLQGNQVDIDNEIDWHESHVLLKAAFPLAASGPFATYEIPYGTIDRPTTRNNSWEKAQFEVTALRWADLSGPGPDGKIHGLSILNQNKYGYDAVGNVLRLTLLRSPKWPDAEADMGHHHFHYALYPHAGTWKDALTVRHGYEYNYPLTAVVTTAHPGTLPPSHSFASVAPENVVLTAVKKAEDANGLIFRVYEWAGKETIAEFHVPPGATGATVTNLMETPEGSPLPVTGDVVKAPIHPYEILTIRVDYPNAGPKP
jgi:alpha-mannosidase